MTLYVGKNEYGKLVSRRTLRVRDSFALLYAYGVEKRQKAVTESFEAGEYLGCEYHLSLRKQRGRCREPEKVCEV